MVLGHPPMNFDKTAGYNDDHLSNCGYYSTICTIQREEMTHTVAREAKEARKQM